SGIFAAGAMHFEVTYRATSSRGGVDLAFHARLVELALQAENAGGLSGANGGPGHSQVAV
ncbi:MAG: hypothetical protein ACKO2L_09345, partial [Planctomycetaceae bacterium]